MTLIMGRVDDLTAINSLGGRNPEYRWRRATAARSEAPEAMA